MAGMTALLPLSPYFKCLCIAKCIYGFCGSVQLVWTTLVATAPVAARITEAGMALMTIVPANSKWQRFLS
jgi:hypothetical protein